MYADAAAAITMRIESTKMAIAKYRAISLRISAASLLAGAILDGVGVCR